MPVTSKTCKLSFLGGLRALPFGVPALRTLCSAGQSDQAFNSRAKALPSNRPTKAHVGLVEETMKGIDAAGHRSNSNETGR
jgi:hypothetical protein